MWLYFNRNGQLLEALEHGPVARAGTTNFEIFAYFEGAENEYEEATLKLYKPDLRETAYIPLLMQPNVNKQFHLQTGEYSQYFSDGVYYRGAYFNFGTFLPEDEIVTLLDTPGMWKAIITLFYPNGNMNVQGILKFAVQQGNYSVDGTVVGMEDFLNGIINRLAQKLSINDNSYIKVVRDSDIDENDYLDSDRYGEGDIVLYNNGLYRVAEVLAIEYLTPVELDNVDIIIKGLLKDGNGTEMTLSDIVTRAFADGKYLTILNAADTYLRKDDANEEYLKKNDAASTYLSKTQAQSQYQKKLIAGHNIYIDEMGNISAGGDLVGILDPVTKLPFATFNDLPTPSAATCGAIYFVADPNPESENNCIEYMTIYYETTNTYAWEKYGQATIDLSNYCTLDTAQTIVADKSITQGKKVTFLSSHGPFSYVDVYSDGSDLNIEGPGVILKEGAVLNIEDENNEAIVQLGFDVGESGGYIAALYGIVGIYNTVDNDENTVQSSIDFADSDGTLKAQIYEDRIEYDIDNSTKTITYSSIYNAVNNALINSSSTATTVAIGTLMTDINAAESVFIGAQLAAGNVNRTNQVVIGYQTRGAKDSVVIGHGSQIINGSLSILIGECILSDESNTNDILIGSSYLYRGGGHTAIGWGIKGTNHNSVYPSNDVIIGRNSANAIDKAVSFDGPTINRPIIMYSTDFIKFRNANLDLSKSSFSDYTNGKTLTEVLNGETHASETFTYNVLQQGTMTQVNFGTMSIFKQGKICKVFYNFDVDGDCEITLQSSNDLMPICNVSSWQTTLSYDSTSKAQIGLDQGDNTITVKCSGAGSYQGMLEYIIQ